MKWKNPDELRRLGFWRRGGFEQDESEFDYELCLADDPGLILFEIHLSFANPWCEGKGSSLDEDQAGAVYLGAELRIFKLRRERLAGPLMRGALVGTHPLFFTCFRDVEAFVAALTGSTPLFPESREPQIREAATADAEDLYRNALSLLGRS